MKKNKLKETLNILLIGFLIIQPIFDLKIFYNSISTLIRVIIIGILFLIYFYQDKNKKKYYLVIYPLMIITYFIFHHINAENFRSQVPNDFNYSIIKEILYIVKMIIPFLLIYVIYRSKLSKNQLIKIMKYITIIMSITIIVTNIFGISYGSYSDKRINANFFKWFGNNDYTYRDLASKGLFEYANQIGAVLIMFLPIIILDTIKGKDKTNLIVLIINILALMMLGTKVAVLGIIVSFVYTVSVIIFIDIIKKNKLNKKELMYISVIMIIYFSLLPFNPMFNRIEERNYAISTSSKIANQTEVIINDTKIPNQTENITKEEYNQKYIEEHYKEKFIPEQFIMKSYPYKYDTEFWMTMFERDATLRTNYRFIEKSMIERVVELNGNKLDKWFGITNTRLQNIFNIEQDFIVQYYALGIIGLILIFMPYLLLIIKEIYEISKNKFKNVSYIQIILLIDIALIFLIAYFSGNLLNSLSFTIYFALIYNLLIVNNNELS